MGGFMGIGASGAEKQDRRDQLAARSEGTNVFNYAFPQAQQQQRAGSDLVGDSGAYFSRLLRAGRSDVATSAAPALNANLSAADAAKRRESLTGTGRTGGATEADRMLSGETAANNANIINQTMQQQKQQGGEGTLQAGSQTLSNAMQMLGLSEDQIKALMKETGESRVDSRKISNESAKAISNMAALFI